MKVRALSVQSGLRLELVDWYRDATSVPYGHLLIGWSPRTDDRIRFFTNTGANPSKFYVPDWLRQSNFLDNEHTRSLYSPTVPIIFPQMEKSFRSVLPERAYQVSLRMHSIFWQRKPPEHKKISRDTISKRSSIFLSKQNHWEARKSCSDIQRSATTHRSH